MSTEIKVPQLPESVSDATLVNWHKKEGDQVERDENLVDIETDKVVLEVPAPAAGVLGKISVTDGTTVKGGQVIGSIEEGDAGEASDDESKEDRSKKKESSDEGKREDSAPKEDESKTDDDGGSGKLSPSVRRLLDEHDLDASEIEGTGRHGRLTKADVEKHLKGQEGASKEGKAASKEFAAHSAAPTPAASTGGREDRRMPMTRMRSRIAERMVEAQSTAAMLTSFNEADMSAIMALRARYKEPFEKKHGVKLGFMSFFVKAACEALKRHPVVNASLDGNEVVYHDYYDVGIAVSVPKGLVVPIIRDADRLDFAGIENTIAELAGKGRDGSLTMDDLTGGTFTITNGGVFGSLVSTPILNMPQSAILGMHKIQERPVAIDGEVVIRPMMYLALTYDHRIIDGKDAVQFLVAIKECLEDPARLAIGI